MQNNISIIIPVHNNLRHTSNCLNTLFGMLLANDLTERVHIIVIDDGSSDNTAEWIKEHYPQTIVLFGDGTLWWSGAINIGTTFALQKLNSEYVVWWNNDISPSSDYLVNLMQIIDSNGVYIGGSKIYYADEPNKIWSMGGIFNTRNGNKYMIGMNEIDRDQYNEAIQVDWLPGMGTFIHKSVFDKIGYVDNKNFPQYHGDSDFTFMANLAEYKIMVYPELKIWNDKSNSGLMHQNSTKLLIRSLTDIKSNYHILKDIRFYQRYATSIFAYQTIVHKYCYYIGGFIKWKFLNLIGLSKKESRLNSNIPLN